MRQSKSQLVRRGNPKAKSQGYAVFGRQTLQSKTGFCAENQFAFNRLAVVHGRRTKAGRVDVPCRSFDFPSSPKRRGLNIWRFGFFASVVAAHLLLHARNETSSVGPSIASTTTGYEATNLSFRNTSTVFLTGIHLLVRKGRGLLKALPGQLQHCKWWLPRIHFSLSCPSFADREEGAVGSGGTSNRLLRSSTCMSATPSAGSPSRQSMSAPMRV